MRVGRARSLAERAAKLRRSPRLTLDDQAPALTGSLSIASGQSCADIAIVPVGRIRYQRGRGSGSLACACAKCATKRAKGAIFAQELACSSASMYSLRRSTGITVQTWPAGTSWPHRVSVKDHCCPN